MIFLVISTKIPENLPRTSKEQREDDVRFVVPSDEMSTEKEWVKPNPIDFYILSPSVVNLNLFLC